jgi:hypothetical protein
MSLRWYFPVLIIFLGFLSMYRLPAYFSTCSRVACTPADEQSRQPVLIPKSDQRELSRVLDNFKEHFKPLSSMSREEAREVLSSNMLLADATIPEANLLGQRLKSEEARELQREFVEFLENYRDAAGRLKFSYEEWSTIADERRQLRQHLRDRPRDTPYINLQLSELDKKQGHLMSSQKLGKEEYDLRWLEQSFRELERKPQKMTELAAQGQVRPEREILLLQTRNIDAP